MITDVTFISLEEARHARSSLGTLLISILDKEEIERHGRPKLAYWRSVLCLKFEDTCEESKLTAAGAWPDEPSDVEHAMYSQGMGERIPTLDDAIRIVAFVMGHHATDERLHLLVHCFAGISRSGAVAKWVSENLGVPRLNEGEVSLDYANKRVLRLMDKAYAMYQRELGAALRDVDQPDVDRPAGA